LPARERVPFWLDIETGQKYEEPQFKKIPLNPDAFILSPEQIDEESAADIKQDQEEIVRAYQSMKDEGLSSLINDLNNVDEDPLNPVELKQMMHARGAPLRLLGKICTNAALNHTREIAVTEVIARAAKMLIKDGLVFLSEDDEAGFTMGNIKKCIQHYLHEIFSTAEDESDNRSGSVQNIWDFISDHARRKYNITIEKEVLNKIHLNSLFSSILAKLNITLRKDLKAIDF